MPVTFVTNGGIGPSPHPLVSIVVVEAGADAADIWIAERIGPGDVCVTADVPLAARCIERGRGRWRMTARPSRPRTWGRGWPCAT